MIVCALGLIPAQTGKRFGDVDASAWYSGTVATANAYDLINGYEDGNFRPNERITREQAMAIIARAMGVTRLDIVGADSELARFTDVRELSGWAVKAAATSVKAGLVSGRDADKLAPKAFMTRAEAAAIVQRLLKQSELI
ncbi:S-layer homology domain-containing protein [Paenibacillus koleovorans]|uniref:S-layer homology domain-containing protein n=1 Tax=Paenibacillus koleovorans TaxID=121608 RepID=UPI000FD9045B|nr:S-layer homology domain-containing protein [Paenibacillus koleovorans]